MFESKIEGNNIEINLELFRGQYFEAISRVSSSVNDLIFLWQTFESNHKNDNEKFSHIRLGVGMGRDGTGLG